MPAETEFPAVDVAAVLVTDPTGRILVDYNDGWKAFTIPMTKLHPLPMGDRLTESAGEAACRAAAEVLGRPVRPSELRPALEPTVNWNYSLRDGQLKRYKLHLFTLTTTETPHPLPGHIALWQTRQELTEREPVSPTVAVILDAIPA